MARYEDYVNKSDGLDSEITDAQQQQEERQRDPETGQFVASTPAQQTTTDWESRYKDLEKHNSYQAQTLGQQRKIIDDFILNPTSQSEPVVKEPSVDITPEDFYDNPAEAVQKAVDAHPAIIEARTLVNDTKKRNLENAVQVFQNRHPDYQEISAASNFRDWVGQVPMRQELYARGNDYDLSAADALFSLYKAEKGLAQVTSQATQQQAIEAVELESSSAKVIQEPAKYSRSEYIKTLTRANQGDLEARDWIDSNAAGYRIALGSGNVRD
jgi:hypothetical protein